LASGGWGGITEAGRGSETCTRGRGGVRRLGTDGMTETEVRCGGDGLPEGGSGGGMDKWHQGGPFYRSAHVRATWSQAEHASTRWTAKRLWRGGSDNGRDLT
jgi:hypothetical protein